MTQSIEPTGVDKNPASNETVQHLIPPPPKPSKTVHDWLRDLRMSPDVNQTTVGVATDRVTPELMLATSSKLLGISRRQVEPDPKDSLQFQRVYGPNEYFSEHILRDAGRLARQLLWKATNRGNLDFMQTAALDGHVSDVFNSSRLSNMIDGSSPLETVDAAFKVTRIGEGGVGDVSSAPDEMRLVQPSFLGYIDSVRSPECCSVNHDIMTSRGWKPISEVTTDDRVACLVDGRLEWHHPEQVVSYEYDGQLYCFENKKLAYELTGNHRVWCRKEPRKGRWKKYGGWQKEHVTEYGFEYAEDMHNTTRLFMPGGHLPVKHAERRCVIVQSDEDFHIFKIGDWCEFLGWYISEGNIIHVDKAQRAVVITQVERVNAENCVMIKALLDSMGLMYRYNGKAFWIKSRALWRMLQPLGYCDDKYIPDEVFEAPEEAQQRFIDAILRGDGRKEASGMSVLCTTSKKLADDYERLLFSLGKAVSVKFEKDDREERFLGCYTIRCLQSNELWLPKNGHKITEREARSDYYHMKPYKGQVYCVTVPGGLFYTRIKGHVGFWTGNSIKVGLDTYLTKYCMKGSDGKLYQKFINAHTGKPELVDSVTAAKSVVTTPDMMNAKTNYIYALGGKTGVRIVRKKDVDYYLPKMDQAFSTAANLVTGLSGVKEMRLLMGCLHPLATLVTVDKANMVHIDYAKDVNSDNGTIPGTDKEAMGNRRHAIRATLAKFPPGRAWFRKIVLYSGRALTTSKDHRWAVLRNGKVELVDAVKLKPDDKIFRRVFDDMMGRRTFVMGVQVDSALAAFLGYMTREGTIASRETLRVPFCPQHRSDIEKSVARLHLKQVTFHGSKAEPVISIHDQEFVKWFVDNIGATDEARRVPTEILSAKQIIVASFLAAYTADGTKVAQDAQDYTWILNLHNFVERDGIAFLLSRLGTDTYYRDSRQKDGTMQLALKLTEFTARHGDTVLDAVKANQPVQGAAVMVDLDADDNLYASASGVITHNSKYPLQAISIEGREAPYVRNIDSETGKDFHSAIGKYLGARYASKPGTVTAVRQGRIDVLYDDGTKGRIALYNNFPMNAKGYITNTAQVKAGDHFDKGGLLASSNYTDDKGTMATGTNLRVGWLSWKGGTYEDAVILSESAARKLTGSVMYSTDLDLDKTVTLGKRNYRSWKPGEYTKEQLSVLDDNGVVMPGTILHKGDPMVLAVRTTEPSPGTMGKKVLTDISQVWEHDNPGKVTDVVRTRNGVKVLATVTTPVEPGDKVSGLYGNKGVTSRVLPDDQMPVDKDGRPLDMILSPLGLISRTNPMQLMETLLGKIAHKTGKTELIDAFPDVDMHQYILDKLKQNKLSAEDDFFDPETGRRIPGVVNGYSYIHRLKHLAESKESARGTDAYSMDDTPGGSGYAGSKRFGTLEQSAMAGHSAFDNLLDNKLIRGQSNAEFWRSIRTGGIPTIPGEPLVQKKFFAHLQGSGVNVRKTPMGISVFALSNDDVDRLAGPRELKTRDTYEARTFRPIDGGLFGQDVFGQNGDQWGYIQLDEPVPNPVMEEPLSRLLRMSLKDFTAVATGEGEVNGIRGPVQLKDALSKINLDQEARQAMREFKDAPASKRDNALKRYVAVENMRRAGLNPSQYMLDKIPVLPAQFRPVTSHNGLTMVADANYLYAQLLDARDDLRDSKDLPQEYQDKARANLYRTWQELTGMYDPEDVKLRNKNVGGLLKWALGDSPKFSAFQRKVLGGSVDTVGRGVIIPDSRLTMDQLGVPIGMAFDIMAPFVERGLVKRGYSPVDAMKMVKRHDKQAEDVLREVVKTHPVEMNRAPTLHKFNIMAFEPVLVQGHAIRVHPSVCPGFNADFDGDQQIGAVKVRISMDLLQNENIIKKLERDELQKIIAILYYVAGKNGLVCEPTGDIDMAYHKLKTLVYTYRTDGQYVVLDMDLADIPHGRLVTKNGGIKGNADFYEALPGLQVLAYDEKTHKTVWADVAYWSEHKGCAVEIVHLCNGLDIITDDDPRAVYGIAKDADTLVPKRYTPTEALAENVLVPCTLPGLEVSAPEGEFRYVRECDGALFKQDIADQRYELDFAFGQLLGILAGDGWWDKVDRYKLIRFGGPRGVYVSDNEGMNAAYVEQYLNTYVDNVYTYKKDFDKDQYAGRYGDTVRYAMYGKHLTPFCEFLTRLLGGSGDDLTAGSGNKHLPDWMRAAPYEFRRGLLCGLIATDGSISVSEAKGKPQLMIGFCSTSLRLCRELMTLCRSLGVRTSITFSKTTLRGNSAWQVTLSAFDAKKLGLFNDCVNERKAAVFRDTDVNCDEQYSHGDYRVFPKCVVDVVLKWLRAPSRKKTTVDNMSEAEQADARKILSLYMSVAKYKALGYVTRGVVCQLKEYAEDENTRRAKALDTIRDSVKMLENNVKCALDDTWKHSMWRALNLLEPQLDHKLFTDARCLVSRRATAFKSGCQGLLDILRRVLEAPIEERFGLSEEPVFVDWLDMVLSGDCMWATIDNIEKTGQVETGYDLTVPGYETFVSSDGVVLSNTVNVHVPVSDNARREAMDRMRPSRNLIAPSDRKIMYKPEKEYMQGLYFATRLGQSRDGRVKIFRTTEEAQAAFDADIIDYDTPIRILELEKDNKAS